MKWVFVAAGILAAVYLGTVIGVYTMCENTPALNRAKRFAFYIPLFAFFSPLPFIYLFLVCKDKEAKRLCIWFLRKPYKCLIVSHFFADVVLEAKKERPQRKPTNKAIFSGVFDSLENLSRAKMMGFQ